MIQKTLRAAIVLILFTCASCGFLPHSSMGVMPSQISHLGYAGTDTTAMSVGGSFSRIETYTEDFSRFIPLRDSLMYTDSHSDNYLNTMAFEFNWSQNRKSVRYGFGATGYLGVLQSKHTAIGQTSNVTYGGIGAKGMVGVPIRFKNTSWYIINLQSSIAYDFGEYPELRGRYSSVGDDIIVPSNVLAHNVYVYSGFDFAQTSRVRFTYEFGITIDSFVNTTLGEYVNLTEGFMMRGMLSIDKFLIKTYFGAGFELNYNTFGVGLAYCL